MKTIRLFVTALGVLAAAGAAAADVPADRLPPGGWHDVAWADPAPGKWTETSVATLGIQPDTGQDQSAALAAAISKLAPGCQVLTFPPGEYIFNNVRIGRSNLILRGAGPRKTFFRNTTTSRIMYFTGASPRYGSYPKYNYQKAADAQPRQITADVPPGGVAVQVADAAGLAPGHTVLIEEDLDEWTFARRSRGGIFVVVAVQGNTVTLDRPLALGLDHVGPAEKNAILIKFAAIQNIGIENLSLAPSSDPAKGRTCSLSLIGASNAFVRNVTSYMARGHHIDVSDSRQVVVTDCFFDRAAYNGFGNYNGYGVRIAQLTTGSLVANNVFKDLRHPMPVEAGPSYNVFAYNFDVDRVRDYARATDDPNCQVTAWLEREAVNGISNAVVTSDVVVHGNTAHWNLYEGNVAYHYNVDRIHKTSGPHMFFRNKAIGQPLRYNHWMEGMGMTVQGDNHRQAFVGNVLANGSALKVLRYREFAEAVGTFFGANVVGGQVEWGALAKGTALPPSLFLKKRPAFWPAALAWPPFGPEVAGAVENKIPAQLRYELLAHWTLDDGAGEVAADASGNENVGTLHGPAWQAAGRSGKALAFDGKDDYVDLGNDRTLQLAGAMTLAAWVKRDAAGGATLQHIVSKNGGDADRGWALFIDPAGKAGIRIATCPAGGDPASDEANSQIARVQPMPATAASIDLVGTTVLPVGRWVHVAGTFEPGVAVRIYVGGVKENERAIGKPAFVTHQHDSRAGAGIGRSAEGAAYFRGLLDDVRIYRKALSPAEVQALVR